MPLLDQLAGGAIGLAVAAGGAVAKTLWDARSKRVERRETASEAATAADATGRHAVAQARVQADVALVPQLLQERRELEAAHRAEVQGLLEREAGCQERLSDLEETVRALARQADGEGGAPGRVLVVEDDDEVRDALGELLRAAGHRVLLAASVAEAMRELAAADLPAATPDAVHRRLREGVLDVVVADHELGAGPKGAELLRELARGRPPIAGVLYTAYARAPEVIAAAAGERGGLALRVIDKAAPHAVLLSAIDHQISLARLWRRGGASPA